MNDAEYIDTVANVIATAFGPSDTSARLQTVAHAIRQRDLKLAQVQQQKQTHIEVDRTSNLGNIAVGMDRAYREVPTDVYHDLLADVARLKQKVWRAVSEAEEQVVA